MIPSYHFGEVNHCPGCGRTHWHVGRITAECAFCRTALLITDTSSRPSVRIIRLGKGGGKVSRMAAA